MSLLTEENLRLQTISIYQNNISWIHIKTHNKPGAARETLRFAHFIQYDNILTIFTRETYLLDPLDRAFVMSTRKSKSGTRPGGSERCATITIRMRMQMGPS